MYELSEPVIAAMIALVVWFMIGGREIPVLMEEFSHDETYWEYEMTRDEREDSTDGAESKSKSELERVHDQYAAGEIEDWELDDKIEDALEREQ